MAKKVHKVGPLTEGKKQIIAGLLEEYDIETTQDIQAALADLLGGTIKEMMGAEMDDHLGYSKSERNPASNARNGHKTNMYEVVRNDHKTNIRTNRRDIRI